MAGLDLSALKPYQPPTSGSAPGFGSPASSAPDGLDLSSLKPFGSDSAANIDAAGISDQPTWHGIGLQTEGGFNAGVADVLGAPVDFATWLMNHSPTNPKGYQPIQNPFGGSESIKHGMESLGIEAGQTAPVGTAERLANAAGQGAAAMVAPEAAVGMLGKAGAIGDRTVSALGKVFGSSDSGAQLAKNAAIGATSGVGAQVGADVAPGPYKPIAATVGSLLGGGFGVAATEAPAAVAKAARSGADYVAPLTKGGQEKIAGNILNESASSPIAAMDAIDNAPRELVPGSSPTAFQLTGDMGLGQLERSVATKNPELFQQLRADQNAARLDALSNIQAEGHPEAVSDFFRSQLADLDASTQAAHDAAMSSARSSAEGIGGGQPPEVYGEQARTALQNSLDAAKAQENSLWKAVDPNGNMMVATSPIKSAWEQVYGNLSPERARGLTPAETDFGNLIQNYGQVLPLQRLTDLRSEVSQAMRDANSPIQPNSVAYGRLTQLRGAIESAISDSVAQKAAQEQQAVAEGALSPDATMGSRLQQEARDFVAAKRNATGSLGTGTADAGASGPVGAGLSARQVRTRGSAEGPFGGPQGTAQNQGPLLDQAARDRLNAATQATAERKQTFGAKPVAPILKRLGKTYPYDMGAGSVASSVWKAGNGGGDALRAVLKASPEAIEPIKDIAAQSLRSKAPDGIITQKHLDQWKAQHAPALKALEEASPGATAPFQDAATAGEHVVQIAAQRKASLDAYQKSAIGRILKVEDPADVTKAVGSLFGRNDSVKAVREVVQEAKKSPEAMKGLRKAVVDYMESKLISNTEAATSGRNLIKADQFQTFLGKNAATLKQVFSEDEMNSLRAIAQDLKRANRTIASVRLPGGSNTAQDLLAALEKGPPPSLLGKILQHRFADVVGGGGGFVFGGPFGAVMGAIGAHALASAREAGLKNVNDLLREAMLNPDLAKTLMMKAPKRPDTGSAITLAQQLRRLSVLSPSVARLQSRADGGVVQWSGKDDSFLDVGPAEYGRLSSYDPTIRDRLGDFIYDTANALGMHQTAQRMRNEGVTAADFIPVVGNALAANDAGRAVAQGNYGQAAMAAVGAIPIPGSSAIKEGETAAAKLARGAFQLDYFGQPVRILQNPTAKELSGFLNRTKYKAARRITDPATGENYVWDAADPALHQLVADQLGLSPQSVFDMIGSD